MEKLIKNGKVAVLYSPGSGAGWSTWNEEKELIFDPNIVEMVLKNKKEKIPEYIEEKYKSKYVCTLGCDQLKVQWLPIGTKFTIEEYDGHESIEVLEDIDFLEA